MNKETFSAQAEQINLETYNPTKSFIPTLITALARIDAINNNPDRACKGLVIDPVIFTQRALLKNKDTLSKNVISILDVFCPLEPKEITPSQHTVYNFMDRVTGDEVLEDEKENTFRRAYQDSRVNLGYSLNYTYLQQQANEAIAADKTNLEYMKEKYGINEVPDEEITGQWTELRLNLRSENNLKKDLIATRNEFFNRDIPSDENEEEPQTIVQNVVNGAKEEIYSQRDDERSRRSQRIISLTQSLVNIPLSQSADLVVGQLIGEGGQEEISKLRDQYLLAMRRAEDVLAFTSYKQDSFRRFRDGFIENGIMRTDVIPNIEKINSRVSELVLGSSLDLITDRTKLDLNKSNIELPDGSRVDAYSALQKYAYGVAVFIMQNPEKKDEPNK